MHELGRIGLHDIHGRLEGVRHIHHVHVGSGGNRADEFLALDGRVEDFHGVVRGAATGQGDVRNQAREAHGTRIHPVFVVVVVAEQLGSHLGDAIHGAGPLDGILGRVLVGRFGTEGADGTGGEDGTALFAGNLQDVDEAVHLDIPGHQGFAFGYRGKQGRQVIDGIDLVFFDRFGDLCPVGNIYHGTGTALKQFSLRFSTRDIAGDNRSLRQHAAEFHREFGADLTG